jgi:hypothetical protein
MQSNILSSRRGVSGGLQLPTGGSGKPVRYKRLLEKPVEFKF